AQIIKSRYPKTEFNIIGFIEPTESNYELKICDLEKKGIVYYLGQQKDVIPHITRSHAIIHPSVYGEGMSNVLLENASSGRVLITTDNPGCKEIVKDRETGYIF
ncbi:glycosyltransferase, partial [Streptococcus pneumoniae]